MSLAKLKRLNAHRVLGVDASTNSIAFCILEDKKVVSYGEVFFEGSSIYERILDAKRKVAALSDLGTFKADFMAIEAGVLVRSPAVAIKLAYVFGTIMGEILDDRIKVVEVTPITWQSYIGNKTLTKDEKAALKKNFPGHTESWYKNKSREIRKQRTIDFVKSIGVITDSDNVADAAGVAWYAANTIA